MDIILDTNIIRQDFTLKSSKFRALFDYVKKTDSDIILFEIVLREVLFLYRKEISALSTDINKKLDKLNYLNLDGEFAQFETNIDNSVHKYKTYLLKTLKSNSWNTKWKVVRHKKEFIEPILDKAIEKAKPFNESGKGFKDALLWECIKYYCSDIGYSENTFISLNKNDFGNVEKNKFFKNLNQELEQNKIQVNYFTSLQDFLKEYAEKIEFVNLDWVNAKLNFRALAEHIVDGVNSNRKLLALILDEVSTHYVPGEYEAISANNIKIQEYSIYPFSDTEYLISLYYTVNIDIAGDVEISRIPFELSNDSIYRDDEINNFSPMEK